MSTPNHTWRQVLEFPDYEVSDCGLVRSWKRKTRVWRNPRPGRRESPVIISGSIGNNGYLAFILRKPDDPRPYRRLAHRLVAAAFLPAPEQLQTDVCHCDGNKLNNHASNLRWDTHKANQMDMRRHGTMQDGERCCTAKLTEELVARIRREVASGPRGTQRRLARELSVSPATICHIVKGRGWSSIF